MNTENENAENNAALSATPYDDVFRTMLADQTPLVLPVLNEVFGEHYTGDEEIVQRVNEHYIRQQDGAENKVITDSDLKVFAENIKDYLFECQSRPDSAILVRLWDYSSQIAIDDRNLEGDVLEVHFPRCAVLYLRSTKNTPDEMEIRVCVEDSFMPMKVRVMKLQDYTLDELFDKKLYFLLPFYLFNHEAEFEECENDEQKLRQLTEEFKQMTSRLNELEESGEIDARTKGTILDMGKKVTENLAVKYDNVKKEVRLVMGGQVLDYETKRIYTKGIQDGVEDANRSAARELHEMGLDDESIARATKSSIGMVQTWIYQ